MNTRVMGTCPSPRPSPGGRGRMLWLVAGNAASFGFSGCWPVLNPNTSAEDRTSHNFSHALARCSLSLRERVRVRGCEAGGCL